MSIDQILLRLTQATNSITRNPLLHYFDLDDFKLIETAAATDSFLDEKRKKIKAFTETLIIDFDPKLKSAFDEYIEAMVYINLKAKFSSVSRIAEGPNKTPDFKIEFKDNDADHSVTLTVFAELKTMSYASNNSNYLDTMRQGVEAQISLEKQIAEGRRVAVAFTETAPLLNTNRNYDQSSTRYVIELFIEKISQNLKRGQFSLGETVLIVNLKQLLYHGECFEASIPVFQEKQMQSLVSGTLWNTAFGKSGYLIYKPIEFEGTENTDGELGRNGILIDNDWVKAVVFLDYGLGGREPKTIGLYRYRETSNAIIQFLHRYCDFVNDEVNSNGWRITQPVSIRD